MSFVNFELFHEREKQKKISDSSIDKENRAVVPVKTSRLKHNYNRKKLGQMFGKQSMIPDLLTDNLTVGSNSCTSKEGKDNDLIYQA